MFLVTHKCPKFWPWQQVVKNCAFFLHQISVCFIAGSHRQPGASATPDKCFQGFRDPVLYTLGIPFQGHARLGFWGPGSASLGSPIYRGRHWICAHIALPCPDSGCTCANRRTWGSPISEVHLSWGNTYITTYCCMHNFQHVCPKGAPSK